MKNHLNQSTTIPPFSWEDADYLGKACSVTDCTGLIPVPPESTEEWESYEDLYPFCKPHNVGLQEG